MDTKLHAELPPLDNEAQAELHEGLLDEALQQRERQLLAALTSLAEMTARAEAVENNLNRVTAQRDALARDLTRLKEHRHGRI